LSLSSPLKKYGYDDFNIRQKASLRLAVCSDSPGVARRPIEMRYYTHMPEVFTVHQTVGEQHIDVLGHVGNLVFLGWLLDAAQAHSAAVGLTWERYRELGGVFVVRRHEVDYLESAYRDDQLIVRTWIGHTGRATSIRNYEVIRDTRCLVRATTTWAFVSLTTGRPCRIFEPVLVAFGVTTTQ
jgi:acyl-CoA thioester hydrolase